MKTKEEYIEILEELNTEELEIAKKSEYKKFKNKNQIFYDALLEVLKTREVEKSGSYLRIGELKEIIKNSILDFTQSEITEKAFNNFFKDNPLLVHGVFFKSEWEHVRGTKNQQKNFIEYKRNLYEVFRYTDTKEYFKVWPYSDWATIRGCNYLTVLFKSFNKVS